ncbi:MAG TPA: MASE3 domain-containing protein [Dehalococcoidales bacterium]|nr:MASE3 domain-containing protein [Dehalococcoidales bacterium]
MYTKQSRWYLTPLVGALLLVGLYLSSLYNYLLFHSFAEIFSVVVAVGIFIIAWNSRRFLDNSYFLFIGVAFLFVAILDLLHTLAYSGMGVFPEYGTNLATQLWVCARYLQGISLLLAPLFIGQKLRARFLFLGYGLITALVIASIFYWDIFPCCFVEGAGLTIFKKVSEYIISFILVGAIFTMFRKRRQFDTVVLKLLLAAILVTIASELSFTLYDSPFGFPNLLGHFLKIAAFYLIYKAIIETGLVKPYNLLFRDLKQREEQYRDLYEEAPDAYLSCGADGIIKRANRSAAELLGYSREELMGMLVADLYADTPNGKAAAEGVFRRFLSGEEVRDQELEVRRADGTTVWVSLSVRPIRDKEGRVVASRSIMADITEHRKLDQLKDDFIGLVSHELRSPMTVITGAINTALTEAERLSPEETRQLLKDAAAESESLSNLLTNLLELSRVQAQRLVLYSEAIDARKIIGEAVDKIKRQYSTHKFVISLPRRLPPIYADSLRLERILYNLLENAVKYSPPGGEVRVSAKPQGEHLVIGVSDQGIGIPPADQAKLFAPFQRLEKRPSGVRGVGLGLMVCRRLVEAHGGNIWVESEPGHGSSFFFTMPLSQSSPGDK